MKKSSAERHRERFEEFVAALGSYVRLDDTGVTDARDETARKIVKVPPTLIAEHMKASDLAAVFSGCVTVRLERMAPVMGLNGHGLQTKLRELKTADLLPLEARNGHPAGAFLIGLIESLPGSALYAQVAAILIEAYERPDVRPYLDTIVNVPPISDDTPSPDSPWTAFSDDDTGPDRLPNAGDVEEDQ